MRTAKPNELRENAFPVMTAQVSEAELARWFPITFQEITDPWTTPEPSKGALVKLESGQYAVIYWGYDSKELTVRIPHESDPSLFLQSFLSEVPVPRTRISWKRPGARLPRHIAAKSVAVSPSRVRKSHKQKSVATSLNTKKK